MARGHRRRAGGSTFFQQTYSIYKLFLTKSGHDISGWLITLFIGGECLLIYFIHFLFFFLFFFVFFRLSFSFFLPSSFLLLPFFFFFSSSSFFSHAHVTLYERLSVRPSVGPSVGLPFFLDCGNQQI